MENDPVKITTPLKQLIEFIHAFNMNHNILSIYICLIYLLPCNYLIVYKWIGFVGLLYIFN